MNAAVGVLLFCIILLGAITCRAEMKPLHLAKSAEVPSPRYYDEQLLNYRMTEFCSVVKKPPKALTDALEEWLKLDAKALPAVLWFNSIAEEYQRAKCGDV